MFGIWEPNISQVIEAALSPGDVVADLGANIGYDALLASKLVGPTGRVVSIEASPTIFETLASNIENNQANNVRIINKAVSDRAGHVSVYTGVKNNLGATTTKQKPGLTKEAEIECDALDQLLTAEEMSRLTLIKIDIEGEECPVMERFLATQALYPRKLQVIVEASTHEHSERWNAIFCRMIELDFRAFAVENGYGTDWYVNWRPKKPLRIHACPTEQTDILFVRAP